MENETLFSSKLASGTVTNQEELDAAFASYPDLAKEYLAIALYRRDVRKWYEDHWPTVRRFLDKDFASKFQTYKGHEARAWEFHLAVVLTENGLALEEKRWQAGPDFCIKTPIGKKIWIEATTCSLGVVDPVEPHPEMSPGVLYSFGGNVEDIHRPRALRITSAIGSKFEKFKSYLVDTEGSGVSEDDAVIIAVNGRAIQHNADASMLFKRAMFGQGPEVLVKKAGKENLEGGFYKSIPTIIKKNGVTIKEIPANFMEMAEFSRISAVLYCGNDASYSWYNGYKIGDDFLFAYHVNPNNPIPDIFFKFGRGIRKNIKDGSITDRSQKSLDA